MHFTYNHLINHITFQSVFPQCQTALLFGCVTHGERCSDGRMWHCSCWMQLDAAGCSWMAEELCELPCIQYLWLYMDVRQIHMCSTCFTFLLHVCIDAVL